MIGFAQTCEAVAATPSKLEKIRLLGEYLATLDDGDLSAAARFFTGNPFAARDPFAEKRAAMREQFFARLFLLGGWIGGTDTYKRTMWAAVPDISLARAGYTLTMRKGLPEPGADNQLIMAGHEAMLAQWFHRSLRRADILLAERWFSEYAAVRDFPQHLWDTLLESQTGVEKMLVFLENRVSIGSGVRLGRGIVLVGARVRQW